MRIRLGTRDSALARWQAEWTAAQLRGRGSEVELVFIRTQGDQRGESLAALGGQGVFTREIQHALLDSRVDLAVHSLKDLPTEQPEGLCLAAVPSRAPCGDVLLAARGGSLAELAVGAAVGTGSLRRRAQLLHARPDLRMVPIRGNVDTRVRKLRAGDYDAIVLAEAGLLRLGLADQIAERLPFDLLLPAVGQGALGLEARRDDQATRAAVAALDDRATHAAVVAERAMLAALRAGCLAPVAGWARPEGDRLALAGRVLSGDGRQRIDAADTAAIDEPEWLGRRVAEQLRERGAAELILSAREIV